MREKFGKGIRVEHDGGRRRQILAGQLDPRLERGRGRLEVAEQRRFPLGSRLDLEVHLRDHSQRAERADVQLHQVVARDVLHHLTAGTRDLAGRVGHRNADHPVADGAVACPTEPVGVGCHHAADRRPFRMRWIEREALSPRPQRRLEVAEAHPRLDTAGEVGRLVLEQPGHSFG